MLISAYEAFTSRANSMIILQITYSGLKLILNSMDQFHKRKLR